MKIITFHQIITIKSAARAQTATNRGGGRLLSSMRVVEKPPKKCLKLSVLEGRFRAGNALLTMSILGILH